VRIGATSRPSLRSQERLYEATEHGVSLTKVQ
jgi:hypothetical protein